MGLLRKAVRKSMPKPVKKARRTVRKATHPVSTARRAATPGPIKSATWAAHQVTHPIDTLEYKTLDAVWPPAGGKQTSQRVQIAPSVRSEGWPKRFTDAWFRRNVPAMSHSEVRALLQELIARKWTDAEITARVEPYCTCY